MPLFFVILDIHPQAFGLVALVLATICLLAGRWAYCRSRIAFLIICLLFGFAFAGMGLGLIVGGAQ